MPNLSNEELEKLYQEAESVDSSLFSEQRSNILLVSGEHYSGHQKNEFYNKIRENKNISETQKLKLTKNHMQKIMGHYRNHILNSSPWVTVFPDNEKEIQDQKTAELNKAIWEDAKYTYRLKERIREWAKDYCDIGEVAVKIFWDPTRGALKGYEPMVDPVMGLPVVDEMGQPQADMSRPVFSGEFVFERVFGFNLLRAPEAKTMGESQYFIVRKMVNLEELKKRYKEDPEKLKFITETEDETYLVFDEQRGSYTKTNKQTLIQEFYFRPCLMYPNGYFYIKCKTGILEHGEIPYGLFPIVYKGFDEIQTTPRSRSKIKQLRPYQIEVNRSASAIATHQITVGDDKLVINNGAKIESGGLLPGVRVIKTAGGGTVTVLPGRSGEQYVGYMEAQIREMYSVADLSEILEDKNNIQDPMINMFTSIKQKKRFSIYVEKFEEFLCEVAELYLDLARIYLPEDAVIQAIGRREQVNISEFKNAEPLGYRIRIDAQVEDLETQMGKQLVLNHALQYVGNQLEKDDIGKIMKAMPFANVGESFDDFTIDYENVKNDILELERGGVPQINPYDNHPYIVKRLIHRTKASDFKFLPPQIQQNFALVIKAHEEMEAQKQLEIQRAQAGFIPTGGALVKADVYVNTKDGKNQRATLPYEALMWLIKRLEQQNMSQEALMSMQQGAVADIAQMVTQGINQGQVIPNY